MEAGNVVCSSRLGRQQRFLLTAIGASLLVSFGVARSLEPDPSGYGTHRQLGFGPCAFRTLSGFRCPSCGMTTAWSHCVRGQLGAGLAANVGGTLAFLASAIVATGCLASALIGCRIVRVSLFRLVVYVALPILVITSIDWLIRDVVGMR